MRHLSISILILMMGSMRGFASHFIGGQIHYEHLGNNVYEVTFTAYRDCTSDTQFDDPVSIGVFNSDGDLVENLEIDLSNATITSVEPESYSACYTAPLGLCIQEAIFIGQVTLPPIAGGYTLTYQRCCRNFSIVNVPTGTDVGITLTTTIPGPELVTTNNSNPIYETQPPFIICLNAPFVFDHSAIDPDGDIITYELCAPLNVNVNGSYINPPGAPEYPPLQYNAGYSADYPLDANPAFSIDPNTGLLTGTATNFGQFVISICMTEWRNGTPISVTNRDIQLNVTTCEPTDPPVIATQIDPCSGLTVDFENDSPSDLNYHWDFGVLGIQSDTSNIYEPTYTYAAPGYYNISLIVNPGLPCADTTSATYFASPPLDPAIATYSHDCTTGSLNYDFTGDGGTNSTTQFNWNFGSQASPAQSLLMSPQNVILGTAGSLVDVTLTVSENGCSESITTTIAIPPDVIAAIEPQSTFCDGYTYDFVNLSQNATSYQWDFGEFSMGDISGELNPTYTYSDTGYYDVQLIAMAEGMCSDTNYTGMLIYGLLDPYFAVPEAQCAEGNAYAFTAEGASTDVAIYTWDFGSAAPSNSSSISPTGIAFPGAGAYEVTLTIAENDCLESYTDEVIVIANPVFEATAPDFFACDYGQAFFESNGTAETQVFYNWDFGDGGTSTLANPSHFYESPGNYDVSVTMSTVSGCIASETFEFPEAVVIVPPPIAGFALSENNFDLMGAETDVTSTASGNISCSYVISDGGYSNDCDFHYTFSESGIITIIQTVVSAEGCIAQATGTVIINGHAFYAPNSFTPDGDGLNDYWLPEVIGASEYQLQIFDRWGDLIFETNDSKTPWTGSVHNGAHFAQNDVYIYLVKLKDAVGLPYEFTGHISLIR